jgi:tetratricopeptide (TPR) repeat protein
VKDLPAYAYDKLMILKHSLYLLLLPALASAVPVLAEQAQGDAPLETTGEEAIAPPEDAAAEATPTAPEALPDELDGEGNAAPAPREAPAPEAGSEPIDVLDQVVPVAEDPVQSESEDAPAGGGAGSPAAGGDDALAGPPAPEPIDSDASQRDRLATAFDRFQEFREAGMLDEAENAAKRAVELSLEVSGPTSNDTAKALTNLATVQYDTKQFDFAKQNFQSAIDIYKETEDQLSARLINPLRGLGAAQLESGRPDQAMETYRQAVHISHVNEGPHNLDQLPILEALAETHLRLGEPDEAKNAQDMVYALNLRHLDGNTMNLVPPLMRRAAWQRRTGYVLDERATLRRVIRIIEDKKGDDDIALIEPLTKMAESYFYVDFNEPSSVQAATIASGEIYFKRAIRIAEESPDSNWKVLANTMLALGDYYNFRSDQSRARRAYKDVWDLLSEDPERLPLRHNLLEQVQVLNEDPIPQYIGDATLKDRQQAEKEIREGSVIAKYDVSSRGRMSSLSIVDVSPPVFQDMKDVVIREMRDRIYRPRLVDGEPVDTENQIVTHQFFYLQGELDQRLASANGGNEEG